MYIYTYTDFLANVPVAVANTAPVVISPVAISVLYIIALAKS